VSRRGNALLGPASSRLEILEPVLDNWEQDLEPADDCIHSDHGEYEGHSEGGLESQESQVSRESQAENELEQHGDDQDLFADWGGGTKADQA